jgi:hypothetical protein
VAQERDGAIADALETVEQALQAEPNSSSISGPMRSGCAANCS